MAIAWTPDLAVGVELIDEQHKELFKRINDLFEACNQGKGKEAVAETIDFLEDYVVVHFTDEQALMRRHRYPQYESHKALHDGFVESLKQLKEHLDTEGPGLTLVLKTNRIVVQWLTGHIRRVDTQFAKFLHDQE
ncbi:MAG: hemerythrin family protein [Firmicutes bacterium]|nr:hemerythrin family protein [Bacillota bacterium]